MFPILKFIDYEVVNCKRLSDSTRRALILFFPSEPSSPGVGNEGGKTVCCSDQPMGGMKEWRVF